MVAAGLITVTGRGRVVAIGSQSGRAGGRRWRQVITSAPPSSNPPNAPLDHVHCSRVCEARRSKSCSRCRDAFSCAWSASICLDIVSSRLASSELGSGVMARTSPFEPAGLTSSSGEPSTRRSDPRPAACGALAGASAGATTAGAFCAGPGATGTAVTIRGDLAARLVVGFGAGASCFGSTERSRPAGARPGP